MKGKGKGKMEKDKYEVPQMELIELEKDVICTSGESGGVDAGEGGIGGN